jgi:hypothetical protein
LPFSSATTTGQEKRFSFNFNARCQVLDPLLGVVDGRSTFLLRLQPLERHEKADPPRLASYLGR